MRPGARPAASGRRIATPVSSAQQRRTNSSAAGALTRRCRSMPAAGTFLAFLVGRAAAFLALLRAADGLVQQVIRIENRLGQKTLMARVRCRELPFVPAGRHGFFLCRLAILVRVHAAHPALAFTALAF